MEKKLSQDTKDEVKILVVDDREDNLFSIEAILEKDMYTIIKANSGRAALKILLQEHDFSLILMDVQMPELNGFETANIIYERDKLKNIPIIFITAYGKDEDHIFRGYQLGGVDYIYKPINPDLLRAKVTVFVELWRKNNQLQLQEKKLLKINRSLQKEIEERRLSEEKIQRLNQQLVQSNDHLKQMNEDLDQFAYMASHDLQEPLRKIQIFSDKILAKKKGEDETDQYFTRIISASKRMQSLINKLLEFSRHSVDTSDFKKTDLNVLIKEVLGELEIEVEKSHAKVYCEDLPVVTAVPALMQRLFYNLLSNAIKFRRAGNTPVVNIKAEKMAEDDVVKYNGHLNGTAYHKITVSDNGIGFDKEHSQDIFKVFKRLHNYQQFEGTGVGLSICKKIIEKHGGFIVAESEPDKGAVFVIGLPESQPVVD
ncbi:MAG TPA: response regulator [Chitinophagaceae bacterium]|nr:response regulator [Chitinophagaceae bacterium]